jgi:transcriptional regulator with XRE-family HTH domain
VNTNQAITKSDFAPGTSRRHQSVHSLALRIAAQLDAQMTEAERERQLQVAQRVRELRGVRTQQWVADKIGVTLRAYQAWEAGGGIAGPNIAALAKLYDVPEDFIVYGSERRATPDQLDRIEGLLVDVSERLARLEDLVTERELEDLEAEAEPGRPARRKPNGRPATGDA